MHRRPWPAITASFDGKTSPFGAVPQQPHGTILHRLCAQSAEALREVTRCLVKLAIGSRSGSLSMSLTNDVSGQSINASQLSPSVIQ